MTMTTICTRACEALPPFFLLCFCRAIYRLLPCCRAALVFPRAFRMRRLPRRSPHRPGPPLVRSRDLWLLAVESLPIGAAFAGVSGGYSANLFIGTVDPLLAGITTEAAAIVGGADYEPGGSKEVLATDITSLAADWREVRRRAEAAGVPGGACRAHERREAERARGRRWCSSATAQSSAIPRILS